MESTEVSRIEDSMFINQRFVILGKVLS